MGAWGEGPFDNDDAADFSGELDEAQPEERLELIVEALTDAADEDEYLDVDTAARAVAAAAVVAAQRPGAPMLDSVYGPQFLVNGEVLEVSEDVRRLALRALDAVADDESEWHDLWEDAGVADPAALLTSLRTALQS